MNDVVQKLDNQNDEKQKQKYLSQCKGKIKYHSEGHAIWTRNQHNVADGEKLNVYRCKFCKSWHIGHSRGQDPNQWIVNMIEMLDSVLMEEGK